MAPFFLPDDGFKCSELTECSEGNGNIGPAQPSTMTKCISNVVEEALNICQSVVDKSSKVNSNSVFTIDAKESTSAVDYIETARSLLHKLHPDFDEIRNIVTGGTLDAWYPTSSPGTPPPSVVSSVPEDGFDDSEFEEYLEGNGLFERAHPHAFTKRISSVVGEALTMCQSVVSRSSQVVGVLARDVKQQTSAVDYIQTGRSLLHRLDPDDREIRNILTGGTADAWYPASSLGHLPSSPHGMMVCFAPVVPVSMPVISCGAIAQEMIIPNLPCNGLAAQIGKNGERAQQTDTDEGSGPSSTLAFEHTSQRQAAALFQQVVSDQAQTKTTLMLRNIPPSLSRSAVMDVLWSAGLADDLALIYLPMNLRSSGNFGYAFVDFYSPNAARHCKEKLEGFMGWSEPSEKVLEVVWSETQGLDAHVQRYKDSPLMHESVEDELKPAMFKNGVRVAFPRPTKPIRAPRLRKTANR